MQRKNYRLEPTQLEAFLHRHGVTERLVDFFQTLPEIVEQPVYSILDCGGGNGQYLDMLLDLFPQATGVLLDSAPFMLERNKPHERKRLLLGDLEDMSSLIDAGQNFDLICFSDVLHHCIADSYRKTTELQTHLLLAANRLLAPGGQIIVCERLMESWVSDDYSAKLTYLLTRNRLLAHWMRFFGANTAGVGVCYASNRRIEEIFHEAGLEIVVKIATEDPEKRPRWQKIRLFGQLLFLCAKRIDAVLFLLKKIG